MESKSAEGAKGTSIIKCLMLGNSCVRKTSILYRYVNNVFNNLLIATVGVDFLDKTVHVDNKTVKLQIWDTSGSEQYRSIARSYYRGARVIFLVFDLTEKKTFKDITGWIGEIDREIGLQNVVVVLLGNKSDLEEERKVNSSDAQRLADLYEIKYFETSAKRDENLEEAFVYGASTVLNRMEVNGLIRGRSNNDHPQSDQLRAKNCCF